MKRMKGKALRWRPEAAGPAGADRGPSGGTGGRQPSERNDSPFATVKAWELAWSEARDGAFLLEGKARAASKNEHAKFDPATEAQAERRMAALACERGIPLADFQGKIKYSTLRMECRFLEARLEFRGARQEARLARLAAILAEEGDAAVPVSWRLGRETVGGKAVFQARAQWLEREQEAKDWGLGALGADINAWGIAWAAAKSDGNLARPAKGNGDAARVPKESPCFGSIPVSWGRPPSRPRMPRGSRPWPWSPWRRSGACRSSWRIWTSRRRSGAFATRRAREPKPCRGSRIGN